jgi:acetylornithine deacetylase/succinyl-diaminopimelate desuccinylase-like protein
VNIRFLWELEEEVGSPNFAETLKAIGPAAKTDASSCPDTVWVSRGRLALGGLRGLQRITFHLETAETDQHSGTTGGAARNPVAELAQLASEIFDAKTGRVEGPGLLRRRREADRGADQGLQGGGLQRQGLHRGPRLQVDPHQGPARRDEADLGAADLRGARPVGGTSGPGVRRSCRRAPS